MNTKSKNSKNKKLLTFTRVNKFDGEKDTSSSGGSSTLSKGQIASGTASAAAGALNLVAGALGSANKIDTSKADNAIAAVDSFQPQASSMDSLANQLNSFEDASTDWKGSDFGMSTKEGLMSLGTSMASGAAAGAALGPWGCVCAGTRVLTKEGVFKNIEDLLETDGILGYSDKAVKEESIELCKGDAFKECIRIELESGNYLECSVDHPIYLSIQHERCRKTINNKRIRYRNYDYVKASECNIGDSVGVIREIPYFGTHHEDKAYLIGMLIGDGTYGIGKGGRLHTGDKNTWDYIETNNLGYVCENSSNINKYNKEFRTYRIYNASKLLSKYGVYGQTKLNKTLPNNIQEWDKTSLANLIAGLWDTDGYVTIEKKSQNYRICFTQSNLPLIKSLQEILIRFGILSSIKVNKPKTTQIKERKVNSKESYVLIIKDKISVINFYNNIHLNIDYKQQNLNKCFEIANNKYCHDSSYLQGLKADKIVKIISLGVKRIYNLEAKEYHNYIANFIVTHNSVAGAAAGLTAAGAGWIANAVKSKAKAEELNRKAEAANYNAKQRSLLAVENFKDDQMNDFMSNIAADGGKIHIKPSKRGTFTAAAKQRGLGVQEFASKVLANKENYSTAMVRKVNFAKNASKWHHAYGGPLYNHTGDWSNGLTFINEGGTHEENPFDGVLMGFDQEGVPNLVEEGEIIYNDYVFSNRLKPSKKQLESTGLNSKYNNWTFAKIVEDLQKSSAETPLDKISKDSLDDMMNTIMTLQEEVRAKKGLKGENRMMANGGNIFDGEESFTEIGPGFSTGTNPLRLEDGKFVGDIEPAVFTSYKPVDISNILTTAKKPINFNNEPFIADEPFDEEISIPSVPVPTTFKPDLSFVDDIIAKNEKDALNAIANTKPKYIPVEEEVEKTERLPRNFNFDWGSLGQALPIISNAAKSIYNAAKPIDYSNVVAEQAYRDTPMMDLPRIGGKQVYKGIDRNRFTNPIINQGRATARDIQNTAQTAGQALASLASANYNTQRAIGEAYANADQQDLANRMQVAQFNLGIDQANANLSQAEQAYNMQRANRIAQGRIQDAATREQLQQMKGQAIDKTSNAAVQGVADLARQNIQWDRLKKAYPEGAKAVAKNGGMLTKRKRRK